MVSTCPVDILVSCGYRLAKIKEWIDARDPNATIIPFSGALELKVQSWLFLCVAFLFISCVCSFKICQKTRLLATATRTKHKGKHGMFALIICGHLPTFVLVCVSMKRLYLS